MNEMSLSAFLSEHLNWHLAGNIEAQEALNADDLAYELERRGYCSEPYLEYEKALTCPINKRRETYCGCAICPSHRFCELLRKEGYI